MFILKNIKRQSILDDGSSDGGSGSDDVLSEQPASEEAVKYNAETALSGFEGEELERASNYANNYKDEEGNLDISKMIKSGFNLESKFGAFTGAPESYEVKPPEGFDGEVNGEDPYVKEFMDKAKSLNMSQDGFNELMDIHLRASVAPLVDIDEMAKEVGPEFDAMRSNMAGFFKNKMDAESFDALNGMINSTASFKALYNVYKASRPTKIDQEVATVSSVSEQKQQMDSEYLAKDESGNPRMRDPIYARSWRERWGGFIESLEKS